MSKLLYSKIITLEFQSKYQDVSLKLSNQDIFNFNILTSAYDDIYTSAPEIEQLGLR